MREESEVSCERAELRSSRGSWSRLRSMLSEPDASRSGKSGLVSASTRRYLKLVIGSVDLQPAERTKARLRVRIGAVHEGVDCGGTAHVLSHTHLND